MSEIDRAIAARIKRLEQENSDLRAQVERMRAALTQFVACCDTAPPRSLIIEIGICCQAAKSALASTNSEANK